MIMENISVVMSGFGPYEGVDVNPAREVPRILAEQGRAMLGDDCSEMLRDCEVSVNAVELPVSFANAWPTLLDAIEACDANIVIATGVKRESRGIALERCAKNLMGDARPDADNETPRRGPIDSDGPAAYWTRLPLRAILKDFTDHEIPATLSSDAGTYVCNSVFYNLMHWSSTKSRVLAGFVSFPLINESPHPHHGLMLSQQVAAGRDLVCESMRYYLRPSSAEILLA